MEPLQQKNMTSYSKAAGKVSKAYNRTWQLATLLFMFKMFMVSMK